MSLKTSGIWILGWALLAGCSSDEVNISKARSASSMNDMPAHGTAADSGQNKIVAADEIKIATVNADSAAVQQQYQLKARLQRTGNQYSILVDTDLTFSQEHYNQEHQYGEGHIHFYVNNVLKGPIMMNGPFAVDNSLLNKGANQIKLTLAGNNHSEPYNTSVELLLTNN